MSSMKCYKPAHDTCQQKCLQSCYGHKPNKGGSCLAGQSTGLYGQATYACTDHNMAKPAMNHSSYGQTYGHPTMPANPNISHSSYGTQTYGHNMSGHTTVAKPVGLGHTQCKDKGHDHNGHAGQHVLHGKASCHGKSHEKKEKKGDHCKEENKGDHCKEENKSLSKKKYKDCNRRCGYGSGTDSSDCDSD